MIYIFHDYYKNLLKKEPIIIKNFNVISYPTIEHYWKEAINKNYENLKSTVERCIILLHRYIENNEEKILSKVNKFIDDKVENGELLDNCRKEREFIRTKIKSNIKSIIRNHFNYMFHNATYFYNQIIKNISKYTTNKDIIDNVDNLLRYEDLTSLIYINYKINGAGNYIKYRHIVIDEAQDYNDFTFYVLTRIFPKASFNIYGDIAQSIYAYRSLDNWESVKNNVFNNTIEIKTLNKSYRTTIEIMEQANKINTLLNLPKADSVIRHGDKVKYINTTDINTIKNIINEMSQRGYKTIAIISKDLQQSQSIFSKLNNTFDIQNIINKEQEYSEGICTIPCHLCKGLEFDGVIINNASMINFKQENILDMKLLYVAMTRSLHNLVITYNDNLTKVLNKHN